MHFGDAHLDTLDEETRTRVRQENFGIVFQFGLLVPELTSVENVALPLLFTGRDRLTAMDTARDRLAPAQGDGAHDGVAGAAGPELPLSGMFWVVSFALVDLALLFALCVAAAALIVHRAEFLMDNRRSLAALAATGVQGSALRKVARRQAILATTPVCVVAALAGLVTLAPITTAVWNPFSLWAVGRAVLMTLLGVGAALLVTMTTRRLLRRATAPGGLHTE